MNASKFDIVIASGNFGQLVDRDTDRVLRAATREEYERVADSWDAGAFGIIGVDHEGAFLACRIDRPLTSTELNQARAMVEPQRARREGAYRNTDCPVIRASLA
jgi:hypothetical protein